MAESFGIPTGDGAARTYFNNTATIIAADPGRYLLQATDAASLTTAAQNYSAAYDLAEAKPTRTELTILAKDEQRDGCEALFRLYLIQIKYNGGISSTDKAAIGVAPPNPTRTSRNVPAEQPVLGILGSLTGSQTLTYTVPGQEGRAKPFGAQTLELRVNIDETAGGEPETAKPVGLFSKNPIGVAFDPEHNKKVATYWARWANVRGQVGPWSNPVSMTIAA
jgi:hypothetical protein